LSAPSYASQPWQASMDSSIAVVQRLTAEGTLLVKDEFDGNFKVSDLAIAELGKTGYWGMLIDPKFGGQGAPVYPFMKFLTRMAAHGHPAVAGLASIHGCIGAVDPTSEFADDALKAHILPLLASGKRISAFALTEPGAGSDLTAVKTTAVPD